MTLPVAIVTDTGPGFGSLSEVLSRVAIEVQVGIGAESGSDLAMIAAVNEFGSDDGHTPERSYLRSTFDEHRER